MDQVWNMLKDAVIERDLDASIELIHKYAKGNPQLTYVDIEGSFRRLGLNLYLIAMERPNMVLTKTNMDLQGNLGKKYTVNYRLSKLPLRPRERELWPATPEENLERLKDAGDVVDKGLKKCSNCEELGHISKNCPQEKIEKERVGITCFNCGESGHRVRDCKLQHLGHTLLSRV
ncbi:hypothetical protein F5Y16DRAFT_201386 [Xylariaceae sp. FL0255]|nr:hypothetical protein F5Y16DRAFT_201386 [Xylariaceae sp. FL0255]